MSTLLEISRELQALLFALEERAKCPEAQEQTMNDWLIETFTGALEERDLKLDNYAALIAELGYRAQARRAEAERLHSRARADEALAERLRYLLIQFFEGHGLKKVETARYCLTLRNNGGDRPLVVDPNIDPAALPQEFQRIIFKLDSSAVRSALESGQKLPFAHLGDRGQHLRIG